MSNPMIERGLREDVAREFARRLGPRGPAFQKWIYINSAIARA